MFRSDLSVAESAGGWNRVPRHLSRAFYAAVARFTRLWRVLRGEMGEPSSGLSERPRYTDGDQDDDLPAGGAIAVSLVMGASPLSKPKARGRFERPLAFGCAGQP